MGKTKQIGKPHNYPTNRKSYKSHRYWWQEEERSKSKYFKKHALTNFDRLKQAEMESKGISLTVWCYLKY